MWLPAADDAGGVGLVVEEAGVGGGAGVADQQGAGGGVGPGLVWSSAGSSTGPPGPRPMWQWASTRPGTTQPPAATVSAPAHGSKVSRPSTTQRSRSSSSGRRTPRTCRGVVIRGMLRGVPGHERRSAGLARLRRRLPRPVRPGGRGPVLRLRHPDGRHQRPGHGVGATWPGGITGATPCPSSRPGRAGARTWAPAVLDAGRHATSCTTPSATRRPVGSASRWRPPPTRPGRSSTGRRSR